MSLRTAYTLWAPVYDLAVSAATRRMRHASLSRLPLRPGDKALIVGVGTGLDLPWLPSGPEYTGIDLTPAMLDRARREAERNGQRLDLRVADATALPYASASFDAVVMHLICAVVPEPTAALAEAARVLRPGGEIAIVDKFLRPGQRAPLRRLAAPLLRRIATRTDVVFEDCLARVDGLEVVEDEALGAGGWFRRIRLRRALDTADKRAPDCIREPAPDEVMCESKVRPAPGAGRDRTSGE